MGGQNTRKKRGGSQNTIKYHYTKNDSRDKWIDAVYPYGNSVVAILSQIKWDSFEYDGPMIIETDIELDDTSPKIYRTNGKSVPAKVPYEVFGGAACELWGKYFPKVPIHKYVDPTGDIDVHVSSPFIVPENKTVQKMIDDGGNDAIKPLMVFEDKFTEYGDAYTKWLFYEIVRLSVELAPSFDGKKFGKFNKNENHETELSDLHKHVGNLLITRNISDDKTMIKIQISTKVLPDTVGHIMELVIDPKGQLRTSTKFKLNGIFVISIYNLLLGQVRGLRNRNEGIRSTTNSTLSRIENYKGFYKVENHCARILYLAKLHKYLEDKKDLEKSMKPAPISQSTASDIIKNVVKHGEFCSIHFGEDYIETLIKVFESMSHIREGFYNKNKGKSGNTRRRT